MYTRPFLWANDMHACLAMNKHIVLWPICYSTVNWCIDCLTWQSKLWVTQGVVDRPSRWFSWPDEVLSIAHDTGFYTFALIRLGMDKGRSMCIVCFDVCHQTCLCDTIIVPPCMYCTYTSPCTYWFIRSHACWTTNVLWYASLVYIEHRGSVYNYRIWRPWKWMLFSVLETLDVYTIFGSDHSVRVYYFRIRKAWKCILFSNLKTLEVQTIIGFENPGGAYDVRNWQPWKCIQLSGLKTLDVYTIFGIANLGSVSIFGIASPGQVYCHVARLIVCLMFDAVQSGARVMTISVYQTSTVSLFVDVALRVAQSSVLRRLVQTYIRDCFVRCNGRCWWWRAFRIIMWCNALLYLCTCVCVSRRFHWNSSLCLADDHY